jgi:hypothetical protein
VAETGSATLNCSRGERGGLSPRFLRIHYPVGSGIISRQLRRTCAGPLFTAAIRPPLTFQESNGQGPEYWQDCSPRGGSCSTGVLFETRTRRSPTPARTSWRRTTDSPPSRRQPQLDGLPGLRFIPAIPLRAGTGLLRAGRCGRKVTHLLLHFLFHFLGRRFSNMGRDHPGIPLRINHRSQTVAPNISMIGP